MSILNANDIEAKYITLSNTNLSIGNSTSNLNISTNGNSSINVGGANGVFVNSTAIVVGNSSVNTVMNSTSISTQTITINGVSYTGNAATQQFMNVQIFTSNGTWIKPSWAKANDVVTIMLWGGGGGANTYLNQKSGGGGGACVKVNILASQCNSICNVVIGAGGVLSLIHI